MTVWAHLTTIFKRRYVLQLAGLVTAVVAIITTLFLSVVTQAAPGVNETLSFQGRLANSNGSVVADGYYNIQFKIYQDGSGDAAGNPGGTLKWTETYVNDGGTSGVQVRNGYFSVNLGSQNPFENDVDWNQDTIWISMNIAGSDAACTTFGSSPCTADGEMLPMKRLTATPFSLNSARLGGIAASGFLQNGTSPQTADFNITGSGTVGGALNVGGTATFQSQADSATAFSVQNASGASLFNVDSTSGEVEIGSASTAGKLVLSDGSSNTATIDVSALDGNYTVSIPSVTSNDTFCLVTPGNCGGGSVDPSEIIQNQNASAQTGSNFWIDGSARADTSVLTPTLDTATATALNIGTTNATSINLNEDTTVAAGKSLTLTGGNTASRPASPTEGMIYFDSETKQLLTYANGKWQSDGKSATFIVAASNSTQAAKDGAQYVANGEDSAGAGIGTLDGDQIEINAALTAASSAGGGTVYLTEGTYTVDASISIPNNVTLAGSGDSTLIKLGNFGSTTTSVDIIKNSDTSTGQGITVRDLKLNGNRSQNTNGTQRGIYFANVGDTPTNRPGANITNITAVSTRDAAIFLQTSDDSSVDNVRVNDVGTGANSHAVRMNGSDNSTLSNSNLSGGYSTVYLSSNDGVTVSGNTIKNGSSYGIYTLNNYNSSVTGNTITANGTGFYIYQFKGTITGNNIFANTSVGASFFQTTDTTFTGNFVKDNGGNGISMSTSSHNNVISSNLVSGNATHGISISTTGAVNGNLISDNRIDNNGGTGASHGIHLYSITTSSDNKIIDNVITDTAGTGNAIYIHANMANTVLSGNTFSGTGTTTINDLSSSTIYNGQSTVAGGLDILFSQADSATAFSVQNASGASLFNVDSTSGEVEIGSASTAGKLVLSDGSSNTATINVSALAGNYTVSIPSVTSNDTFCMESLGNCDVDSTAFIQNQNAGAQASTNFWIDGTARSNAVATNAIDTGTSNALTIGSTNATSINLNQNTQIATGKTLTVGGETTIQESSSAALTVIDDSSNVAFNVSTTGRLIQVGNPNDATCSGTNCYVQITGGDVKFNSNGKSYVNNVNTGSSAELQFGVGGTANSALRINNTNSVTIGESNSSGASLYLTNDDWTVATVNRDNGDGWFMGFTRDGSTVGTISVASGTVSYNAFTGSHYAKLDGGSISAHKLASLTGDNDYNSGSSEPVYGVVESSTANDPKILGSMVGLGEPSQAYSLENPYLVSAAGNGEVWIADNGSGNVEIGDPLISSDIAGHAQRDPGTFTVSHVFAKAAAPIDWSTVTETVEGKKVAKVSILFSFYDEQNVEKMMQDTASSNIFNADSENNKLQIGDGEASGPATVLTLDSAASAPTAELGSMYYDTTLGKVQCYEAAGWGDCGDAPDTFVTLSPEYSNAVMNGADIGTISSDLCSDTLNLNDGSSGQPTICGTDETYNFYNWTSTEGSAQTRSIYVTYQLPSNFDNFVAGSTSLVGRVSDANAGLTYQIYKDTDSGLTSCGSEITVNSANNAWQEKGASGGQDPASCGFSAGDSILIRINMTSKSNANAYVSNLNFAFGNN